MKNTPTLFPWREYSRKLSLRIETPYCIGVFRKEDVQSRSMHLAEGSAGDLEEGNYFLLSWLVDPEDGVILDARFQAFGDTILIGALETSCELVVGKNYDQAGRITADHIDVYLRDKSDRPAFPKSTWPHINLVIEGIGNAVLQCMHLPLSQQYSAPPILSHDITVLEGGVPGWVDMSHEEKLAIIEDVISKEIRPYIELDAGGVEVISIQENHHVLIAYKGSCTTCFSATGATLSYIQQVLTARVWPEIQVIPQM